MKIGDCVKVRADHALDHPGRRAVILAIVECGQPWAVVRWEGEEDPDCFKVSGLEYDTWYTAAKSLRPTPSEGERA